MTLAELLASALPPYRRAELGEITLADPAAYPREGTAQDRARQLRPEGPRTLASGETLLVAVTGAHAVAYRASPMARTDRRAFELKGLTPDAASSARTVAIVAASCIRRPLAASCMVEWHGEPLVPVGESAPHTLDGDSYGLAFALGEVSRLEDRPLRGDVVALGAVDSDGNVRRVAGMDPKLALIEAWLPGIATVLVAEGEGDLARRRFGDAIAIVEVATVAEALVRALPPPTKSASLPEDQEIEARSLLVLALEDSPKTTNWAALVRRADALLVASKESGVRARARLARAIASRHIGGAADPAAFDETLLADLPRTSRDKATAHLLQAFADQPWPGLAERARREIERRPPAIDCTREERMALGAAARCLSVASPTEVTDLAEGIVDGWFQNLEPRLASHALSLLLRCLGLVRNRERLEKAIEQYVFPFRDAAGDDLRSMSFVDYELARALVLTGLPERAVAELARWDELGSRVHAASVLEAPRHRWRARARALQGRNEEAQRERQMLHGLSSDGAPTIAMQQGLAAIDAALETGESTAALVDELCSHPWRGALATAVLQAAPEGVEPARWLSDAYPY